MARSNHIRFKEDYQNLVQPLFKYLYYKCGDRSLSEDLVQEVFVKYWEKIDTVKSETTSAYLYQIARNLLSNKIERQKVELKFSKSQAPIKHELDPQHQLEEKEFSRKLESAISELPETQREVFLMHRLDGLKYKDIAIRLEVSQKAVEKRMSQALMRLRKLHPKL